jgi:hypothetical protein
VADWIVLLTDEVTEWLAALAEEDDKTATLVRAAIRLLATDGPGLGRPIVDTVKGSAIKNLKELRPGSSGRTEMRILFVFDPWRQAILLVAGDKSTDWNGWYKVAVATAERLDDEHLCTQEQESRGTQDGHPQVDRGRARAVPRRRGRGKGR